MAIGAAAVQMFQAAAGATSLGAAGNAAGSDDTGAEGQDGGMGTFADSLRAAGDRSRQDSGSVGGPDAASTSRAAPATRDDGKKAAASQNDNQGEGQSGDATVAATQQPTAKKSVAPEEANATKEKGAQKSDDSDNGAEDSAETAAAAALAAQLAAAQSVPMKHVAKVAKGGGGEAGGVQAGGMAAKKGVELSAEGLRVKQTITKQDASTEEPQKAEATQQEQTTEAVAEQAKAQAAAALAAAGKAKAKATLAKEGPGEKVAVGEVDDQDAAATSAQAEAALEGMIQKAAGGTSGGAQGGQADAHADQDKADDGTATAAAATAQGASEQRADAAITGAQAAAKAQESQQVDREGTFDQIVLGLQSKFDARAGKAEISLEPPNLGKVHVSISLEGGALTAQFRAASEPVRDLLNSNLDRLKSSLEAQGVAVDRLAVNANSETGTSGGSSGGNGSPAGSPGDGRSAGEYSQGGRQQDERKRGDAGTFSKVWQAATSASKPIDVVG